MKNVRYDVSPAKYQRGNAHHSSFNSRRTANYCVLTIPNACPRDLPNPSTIHQPAAPDRLQGQCYSNPSSSSSSLSATVSSTMKMLITLYSKPRTLHLWYLQPTAEETKRTCLLNRRDSTTSPGVVQMNSASRTQPNRLNFTGRVHFTCPSHDSSKVETRLDSTRLDFSCQVWIGN